MAAGGFLGGYLYDVSHSYVSSWLISFGSGLISSLLAMDLLIQGDQMKAEKAAEAVATAQPAQTTSP
jgi:hypothetical protein